MGISSDRTAPRQPRAVTVGVISDTHGLIRPEALEALQGSDAIIHAGDIGPPFIIESLARIAPVTVVRGNVDRGVWADTLPSSASLEIGGARLLVLHDLAALTGDPAADGVHAVISGHSHKPAMLWKAGVLYLNPGSAGRRRFSLPVSVARLRIDAGAVSADLLTLDI